MTEESVQKMKKILALIVGLALMFVSVTFSISGFNFEVQSDPAGVTALAMAIGVIAIELVFNGQLSYNQVNITLYVLGILAYAYGVISNVIGFWAYQGIGITTISDILRVDAIFGLIAGIFLEIAPEPLIIYGLIGISNKEGDLIGALFNTFGRTKTSHSQKPPTTIKVSNNNIDNKKPISVNANNNANGKYIPQHRPTYGNQNQNTKNPSNTSFDIQSYDREIFK